MAIKKTSTEKTSLATHNNILLLSSFIDDHNKKDIAKEIFGLLNQTPDTIITHFIAAKNFDKARYLVRDFFPKNRKDYEQREEYYASIYEQVYDILKQIGSGNMENIDGYWREVVDSMLSELHMLLDESKNKNIFLARLHRLCIQLLEMCTIYSVEVVIAMVKYFGERKHLSGQKRPEFILDVPSALIKWNIETIKNTEDDEMMLSSIVDLADNKLPEGEKLRHNEWLSIVYDEKKECVNIKPNKSIVYHIAEGENLPRESKLSSQKQ